MTRKLLAAAAASAPLLLAAAAQAQVTVSNNTNTPVATATANNGQPADVDVTGSIGLTSGLGPALTVNSNNSASLTGGELGATDLSGAAATSSSPATQVVGARLLGGYTSPNGFTNTGTIDITESYVAPTDNNTGLLYGAFANGQNRVGLQVLGTSPWVGNIVSTGSISVNGNSSYGVDIEGPVTGSFTTQTVSPTTFDTTTTVTVTNGSITTLGSGTSAFHIAPTGSLSGSLTLGTVSETGTALTANGVTLPANAINILGGVGGTINLNGTISTTGFRTTTRGTDPTIETQYRADSLQIGDAAVVIGGNVGGGLIVSAPPAILSTVVNADVDGNGVPDSQQTAGSISSYGSAPALVLGQPASTGVVQNAVMGVIPSGNGVPGNTYGFVNQGTIIGNGLFDPITEPNLGGPVSGTAMQIGTGSTASTFTIVGGIYNSGSITGQAYQANATAIHFLAGGQLAAYNGAPGVLYNDGSIFGDSLQVSSATNLKFAGAGPVSVYGVLIESGASVPSIVNNGSIEANLTANGGYGAANIGAIIDRSGTLSSITNTGAIIAQVNQTVETQLAPTINPPVAIDLSHGTQAQSLTQTGNPAFAGTPAYVQTNTYTAGQQVSYQNGVYQALTTLGTGDDPIDFPSGWRQIGATSPSIVGNVLFGNGGTTLTVNAGTIYAPTLELGTGANTVTVNGAPFFGTANSPCASSPTTCAVVTGALQEGGLTGPGSSRLNISVDYGTLSDLNPNRLAIQSLNVGAHGILQVAADPQNGTNTHFIASGASTFAQGAQIGLNLLSFTTTPQQTFTIFETTGTGTLTTGTFQAAPVGNAPFLYSAVASTGVTAQGQADIQLTVTEKTPQQLGFNTVEGEALDAVLQGSTANPTIESALLNQTTAAGLRTVFDQLLPNQAQGLFDALDAAEEQVGEMISTDPTDGKPPAGGTSLWMQEVNEDVKRSNEYGPATLSKLVGFVTGAEHIGAGGGALGLTLSYLNDNETTSAASLGSGITAQVLEASLYYRRNIGHLLLGARAGVGVAFFDSNRTFVQPGTDLQARANWDALVYDAHFSAAYEQHLGRFYTRPTFALDYLGLRSAAYDEAGGGAGFDLNVREQTQSRMTATAELVFGRDWGREAWLRTELRGGFRDVVEGDSGMTLASYANGQLFGLRFDDDSGGWVTAGFSIKAGSASSYFALEGDFDYRNGEQRYDVRIAGRSIF